MWVIIFTELPQLRLMEKSKCTIRRLKLKWTKQTYFKNLINRRQKSWWLKLPSYFSVDVYKSVPLTASRETKTWYFSVDVSNSQNSKCFLQSCIWEAMKMVSKFIKLRYTLHNGSAELCNWILISQHNICRYQCDVMVNDD